MDKARASDAPSRSDDAPQQAETAEATEHSMGEAQRVSLSTDPRLRLFALGINLLVVIELFVSMFFASRNQERLTPVFFTIFFSLLVPTIIAAFVGRRILGKRLAAGKVR